MTNPNTAPSADSDGGAELPQVDANNSGLAMKLADGREVRARLSVDGGSVCFDLTATNAAHTKIALSFEAIESMRLLANRLAAAQECGEAVAPEAKPTDVDLIERFIAHNSQFHRSADHPAWLYCNDGDGNQTSLRGDLFAAALRHIAQGEPS